MKKRGSAIIIAMLLISAVGTIAFAFSRSLFVEITNANIYENGTIAFYAAESGIEEGLLRYHFDKNSEVPVAGDSSSWLPNGDKVSRSDLTDRKVISPEIEKSSTEGIIGYQQVYDLRMGSRSESIGLPEDKNLSLNLLSYKQSDDPNGDYVIKRDESKKFDLSNIFSQSDVNLSFKPLTNNINLPSPLNEKKCVLIEAKITGKEMSGGKTEERKMVFYSNYPSCNYSKIFQKEALLPQYTRQYSIGADGTVKISNLKSILWPSVILQSANLSLKPIGSDIAFSIERKNKVSDGLMYGMLTNIESTGYYGDVARKVSVSIDRQSGTLYDLFDYVIYKAK